MSVCFILSRSGVEREDFYFPLATERAFQEHWQPVIEALGLPWAKGFACGIEFGQKDFEAVRRELVKIKAWVVKNLVGEVGTQMSERIDTVCAKLAEPPDSHKAERKAFIG